MYSRHDLVWLTRAGWDAALTGARAADRDALLRWRDADWPAVVRRREPDTPADAICLGIPLPPAHGVRQRLGLRAALAHVSRRSAPLALDAALAGAPPRWQAALQALGQSGAAFDLRVFGSLALQTITGLPYLRPASDIDLLLTPACAGELAAGTALLAEHADTLPLDGEIVFPSGDAVSWKEWLGASRSRARVLVKSMHTVRLAEPAALAAMLAPS